MNTLKSISKLAIGALIAVTLFSATAWSQDAPKLTDPEIASVAVTANQIDIDYANLALKKTHNKSVKEFAETMKNDHSAVIHMAVALAKKLGVTPKTNAVTQSLLDGQKKELKTLKSKSGKSFDKAYVDNEVAYHEAVIKALDNILIPQTKNQELKNLLESAGPLFKEHLQHAKMLQSKLK